ncbi:hypothetical protein D1BOALGB6SA_9481 [Olavius sp. associated proteobacterium Delta 1]|nr:hypothetical protein D1BOALGB6SA_9481 [Olavius sp. associated proteobacterium Delta 1]
MGSLLRPPGYGGQAGFPQRLTRKHLDTEMTRLIDNEKLTKNSKGWQH